MPDDAHFTVGLPVKRMAADVLFTDGTGRVLVVEPTYKPTWDIPGGGVEGDESPRHAAQREVQEELGLHVEPGNLIAVDWLPRRGDFAEVVAFLFDGGVLSPAASNEIVVDPAEIQSHRFVAIEEAGRLLDAEQFARVRAGIRARAASSTAYLENGSSPRDAVQED